MMDRRLDTETLIQQCRNGYDASKSRERIRQLELTLELRDKELQMLTTQITNCKQEASIKTLALEESINRLQRQLADMRITVIKTKRAESERTEQQIKAARVQCQIQLQEQRQGYERAYKLQEEKLNEQIRRIEDKSIQFTQLNKEENSVLKVLKEQKYAQMEKYAKSLEIEKSELLLNKKDTQKRLQALKQVYDKMKAEYEISLTKKEETIIELNGQLQGLKLKQRFNTQSLQEEKRKFSQFRINSKYEIEQLTATNQRLQKEIQKLSGILQSKNQQILEIGLLNRSTYEKIAIPPVQACEHIGLIKQLQRNIDLKDEELRQLKTIVQQWSQKIGFNQPVQSRYQKLIRTAQNAQKIKNSQLKALKDRSRTINRSQKFK